MPKHRDTRKFWNIEWVKSYYYCLQPLFLICDSLSFYDEFGSRTPKFVSIFISVINLGFEEMYINIFTVILAFIATYTNFKDNILFKNVREGKLK